MKHSVAPTKSIVWLLISSCCASAAGLESALADFSTYQYGDPQQIVHETRMLAYAGTDDADRRSAVEALLIHFLQSDATDDAKRKACGWLAQLGSEASCQMLEQMAHNEAFQDVAQIALDSITGSHAKNSSASADAPSNQLAEFQQIILNSDHPLAFITSALQGSDQDKLHLALGLYADGIESSTVSNWLREHFGNLPQANQIIALNTLAEIDAAGNADLIRSLARQTQPDAIRLLGRIANETDIQFLRLQLSATNQEIADAAMHAIRAVPVASLQPTVLEMLNRGEPADVADAIQLAVATHADYVTDPLFKIAAQDSHPKQSDAIIALGKVAPSAAFEQILKISVDRAETAEAKDWQLALWEAGRRSPDYDQAIALIQGTAAGAPKEIQTALKSIETRLLKLKPQIGIEEMLVSYAKTTNR